MFQELKVAFGGFMSDYKSGITVTTKNLAEFAGRPLDKSVIWAPARMVDQAESILESWQRNDTDSSDTHPYKLPVIACAMANDVAPTGGDYANPIADPVFVIFPNDPKERLFKISTNVTDVMVQIIVIAEEPHSAKSLAAQFSNYISRLDRRVIHVNYPFAGFDNLYPAHIEDPSSPWLNVSNNLKNVTILAMNLTLKTTIPFFQAPKEGEPNDGNGVPDTSDPAGYPFVVDVYDMNPTRHDAGKVTDDEPPGENIAHYP